MASNEINETIDTPKTPDKATIKFQFGEYVTPNPKPISLGLKLTVDPLVQYEKVQNVETECKQKLNEIKINQENKVNEENKATKKINTNYTIQLIQPTPLKQKVEKQKVELQSLQHQIELLKLENERLKDERSSSSSSSSLSPNEKNKKIEFCQSVNIMGQNNTKNDERLTDKVSVMRTARNSTPYKPKSKMKDNNNDNKPKPNKKKFLNNLMMKQPKHSSRGNYRVTPMPTQPRRISRLSNKENKKPKQETILSPSFEDAKQTAKFQTPTINKAKPVNKGGFFTNIKKARNIGNNGDEETQTNVITDSNMENGGGSSNCVSPILTPVKGSSYQNPFNFGWISNQDKDKKNDQ